MPHRIPALSHTAALLAALCGCSTEPLPAPEGWERAPARIIRTVKAEGPLQAGGARVSLDPPYAVPMGGYAGGSEFRLREQRDPLAARAVVFEAGGLRVAVVGLDLVLIPPELRPMVEATPEFKRAGIGAWTIFATHDHSSLGAFATQWAAQRFGIGSFDPLILRYIALRSAEAIAAAAERLEPVAAGGGSARPAEGEPALSVNRKIRGAPVDPTVRAVGLWPAAAMAAPGGPARPSIRLVNFAAHPTLVPPTTHIASADYPGVLCRALERDGSMALYLNGPCGDVAAGIAGYDGRDFWERRLERIGRRLALLAEEALSGARPAAAPPVVLAYSEGEILLQPRHPWRVPFLGRSIAANYPDRVRARCLRIGDLGLLFFPGEMGSDLGAQVRADLLGSARAGADPGAAGPREVWLVTLADDYLGYVFSKEQYRAGGMSQHLTIYGEGLGDLLRERLTEIGRACFRASP